MCQGAPPWSGPMLQEGGARIAVHDARFFCPLLSMGVSNRPPPVDIDEEGQDTDDGDDAVFAADDEEMDE